MADGSTTDAQAPLVTNMGLQDLRSLKQQDSFLYYSIPGVRSAKMLFKEVERRTVRPNWYEIVT